MLTKTAYMEFLRCPREFWLAHNSKATEHDDLPLQARHLREQGYDVQRLAQKMTIFQTGIVNTQMRFETEDLWTSADIVVTDPATKAISIYEVKSGSKVRPDYIVDVAFQKMVAEAAGYTVARAYVITVDTTYTRNGSIDPDKLLKITDVTDDVVALEATTLEQTRAAFQYLETEPAPNITEHCDAKLDCGFIRHHFSDIPEYNVTHISRLNKDKCAELLSRGILDIRHVPADFKLSERQRRQVDIACSGEPFVEHDTIRTELGNLKYPLNFLDYETFGYAVPHFEGIRPYQQMLFQYSLHTVAEPGAGPSHKFHVSRLNNGVHPARELLECLQRDLDGMLGTVVVWNANFEKLRNKEASLLFPEFEEFLANVNGCVFDLEKIFSRELYLHPNFHGRTSLKKVLPVLCPDLCYDTLEIGDGTTAAIRWYHMICAGRLPDEECEKIYEALCAYCHQDTLAMVRIYEVLREQCAAC